MFKTKKENIIEKNEEIVISLELRKTNVFQKTGFFFFFPLNVLIILPAFCPQLDYFDKNVKGVTPSTSGTMKTSQGSLTKSICLFVHCVLLHGFLWIITVIRII